MADYERVRAVAYLDVENSSRYRRIMHFCYTQNLSVRAALYRDELLEGVRAQGLTDYTDEQLEADLNYLVANGNLTRRQEMNQARSIEEFKNKHFRYQITAASIAIEHLMAHLPQEDAESGDLNAHLFERLLKLLTPLATLHEVDLADQWQQVMGLFEELQQGAALYVNYLTSVQMDQMLQTREFLGYKAEFVHYLQVFIRKMQQSAAEIQETIRSLPSSMLEEVAAELLRQKTTQPSFEAADEADLAASVHNQWQALHRWFFDTGSRPSEYHNLIQQTTSALDRITRVIQSLTANLQQQRSRAKDYRQLVQWFLEIAEGPDVEAEKLQAANQLAAAFLSFDKTLHIQAPKADAQGTMTDLWTLKLSPTQLTSKSRANRRRVAVKPFKRDRAASAAVAKQYREEQAAYKALWIRYLDDGKLRLSDHASLPRAMRRDLLRYISQALMALAENRVILATENPGAYTLIRRNFLDLRRLCLENLGLELIQHPDFYKLEKLMARPRGFMTVNGLTQPMDFVFMTAILTYTETLGADQPFLLSEMVTALNEIMARAVDWTQFAQRRSLVRVLNVMTQLNLLTRLDGELAGYESSGLEVLLMATTYSTYFLAREVDDLGGFPDWHAAVANRTELTTRQQVLQELLFTPGLCRTPETVPLFTYMRNQAASLHQFLAQYTEFAFELTKNVAMLTLSERRAGFGQLPGGRNIDDLLMVMGHKLRASAWEPDEFGQIRLTRAQWVAMVGEQTAINHDWLAKSDRERSVKEMSELLLAQALSAGMVRTTETAVIITPLFGRLDGTYGAKETSNE
ncbi:TIGR02677 family protein [Lacticaseibacillus kribbianus]|uniref:TIGR02677 family protein n=1 Tax=Lacticaseibacillus kribbianus TaxID=2926292 RepID=UPI001CD19791|nr:TIGR02677 family protein [Lacticaseibacillus kribbianus]